VRNILLLLVLLAPALLFAEESRILRFPNSSETEVAFIHAGDMFTVPITGGVARRLTTDVGIELYPRFSPDGSRLAFTAQYDGNNEIYTINSKGGIPKRVTFSVDVGAMPERMGPDKIIMQWTDSENVMYRGRGQSWHAWSGLMFTSNVNGGLPNKLALDQAGYGYMSPDGKKIAYNRVFREYRTWKRYRGGQADDIWIYDWASGDLENITNNTAQDVMPMWSGNKIYFHSDRTGIMNIYVYNLTTKQTKAVTNFTEYDVKFASLGAKHIALENAGYIYLIDLATDKMHKISVEIREDFPDARAEIVTVDKRITNGSLSPDGKRTVVTARGNIYSVPEKKGNVRALTESSGIHERGTSWSPDGKLIAFISDETGEDEIFIMKPDGSDKTQLTKNAESYKFSLLWSPDSKTILFTDKSLKLTLIDVKSKKTTVVTKSKQWEIRDFSWSPDSRWIAFSDQVNEGFSLCYIYNLESKKITQVSDEYYNSYNPVFTPGGNYLFFVSDRTFRARVGAFEWNYQYQDMSKIYGLTLGKDKESPFKYESDEYEVEEKKDGKDDKKKDKKDKDVKVEIDLDGLSGRIFEVPVSAGRYGNLYPTKDHKLYYVKGGSGKGMKTFYYDFKKKKESELGDFTQWEISRDEKKILVLKKGDLFTEDLKGKVELKNKLKTSQMKQMLDHKAEWAQVFSEAHRQMKHFFYAPNMHGVDWPQMKMKYEQFLPHVHHRTDLTYIVGEMISELNVGHAYVGGGDAPKITTVGIGHLGAEYLADGSGYYKINKIFQGRNWEEKTRSPLTEPGIDVSEGDYLISINGKDLDENNTPYAALVGMQNEFVEIEINSKPSHKGSKKYMVKTIAKEAFLRYFNWVEENRMKVYKASNGRVGYIHVPDMGLGNGLNEFSKYFFPQTRKEALIIDDRYNGGGNVSPMIIERLKRDLAIATMARNTETISGKPQGTMPGPVVCLINELSASDGDLFPYQFKVNNLGKIIGKRSWGGVVGIRGSLPFLDGGYMTRPEFANFGLDGTWALEGWGQEPDIEVDNHPARMAKGIDDQLNRAVEEILKDIKTNKKRQLPKKLPEFDDRSKPRN
jgi:tricorn protease